MAERTTARRDGESTIADSPRGDEPRDGTTGRKSDGLYGSEIGDNVTRAATAELLE